MHLTSRDAAFALVERLGTRPWLIQHHRLVLEAAVMLCDSLIVPYDKRLVLIGAALHDVGKIEHPTEMSAPGHASPTAPRHSDLRACKALSTLDLLAERERKLRPGSRSQVALLAPG